MLFIKRRWVLIGGREGERIIELKEEEEGLVCSMYVDLIYNTMHNSLVEIVRSDEMIHSMK